MSNANIPTPPPPPTLIQSWDKMGIIGKPFGAKRVTGGCVYM